MTEQQTKKPTILDMARYHAKHFRDHAEDDRENGRDGQALLNLIRAETLEKFVEIMEDEVEHVEQVKNPSRRFCVNAIADILPLIPDSEPLKNELLALRESVFCELPESSDVWRRAAEIMQRHIPNAEPRGGWQKKVCDTWFDR